MVQPNKAAQQFFQAPRPSMPQRAPSSGVDYASDLAEQLARESATGPVAPIAAVERGKKILRSAAGEAMTDEQRKKAAAFRALANRNLAMKKIDDAAELADYKAETERRVRAGQAALQAGSTLASTAAEIAAQQKKLEDGLKEAAKEGSDSMQKFLEANPDARFDADVLNEAESLIPGRTEAREAREGQFTSDAFIPASVIADRQSMMDADLRRRQFLEENPFISAPREAPMLASDVAGMPSVDLPLNLPPDTRTDMERDLDFFAREAARAEPLGLDFRQQLMEANNPRAVFDVIDSPERQAEALAMGAPRQPVELARPSDDPGIELQGVRPDIPLDTQVVDDALRPVTSVQTAQAIDPNLDLGLSVQESPRAQEMRVQRRSPEQRRARQRSIDEQLERLGIGYDMIQNVSPAGREALLESFLGALEGGS